MKQIQIYTTHDNTADMQVFINDWLVVNKDKKVYDIKISRNNPDIRSDITETMIMIIYEKDDNDIL